MNRIKENSFTKIYALYLSVFIIIVLCFVAFFLLNTENFLYLPEAALIFTLAVLAVGVVFVFTVKSKVAQIIKSVDDIIDRAVNRKDILEKYDETSLSALENKLLRFINMSNASTNAIEKERNKIKSLISDISHQTKTPLANILLYTELLLEKDSLKESDRQLAVDIKEQSQKLNWLIQSLVKMSRLETGIITADRTLTPVIETIKRSVKEVYSQAEKKNIHISISCHEKISACHDSKWTSEAIVNIMENAVKYTPDNGKIHVTVIPYEIFTKIDISDTGIGIDKNELNNIFKRFYRCPAVSQYNGVGIGLYLAREIISFQGGYIKVKSQLGEGSTFSVFLPNS